MTLQLHYNSWGAEGFSARSCNPAAFPQGSNSWIPRFSPPPPCPPIAKGTLQALEDFFPLPLLKSYMVVLFCHSPNTFESLFLKVVSFLALMFRFLLQCKAFSHLLVWAWKTEGQLSDRICAWKELSLETRAGTAASQGFCIPTMQGYCPLWWKEALPSKLQHLAKYRLWNCICSFPKIYVTLFPGLQNRSFATVLLL